MPPSEVDPTAIAARLPPNCYIHAISNGDEFAVTINMTLRKPDHARALVAAIERAILPILEMSEDKAAARVRTEAAKEDGR